jgi:hypothetical protein
LQAGGLRVRNPELARFVGHAPVATKLSGVLDERAMRQDAYLNWSKYFPSGTKLYSNGAALAFSANVAAGLFPVLILFWWALSRTVPGFRAGLWGPWLAHAALTFGLIVYAFALPKVGSTPIHRGHVWSSRIRSDCLGLAMDAVNQMQELSLLPIGTNSPPNPTLGDLNRALEATLRNYPNPYSGREIRNVFTGQSLKCEASPGNVVLRRQTAGLPAGDYPIPSDNLLEYELVWYDLDGAEAIITPLFR